MIHVKRLLLVLLSHRHKQVFQLLCFGHKASRQVPIQNCFCLLILLRLRSLDGHIIIARLNRSFLFDDDACYPIDGFSKLKPGLGILSYCGRVQNNTRVRRFDEQVSTTPSCRRAPWQILKQIAALKRNPYGNLRACSRAFRLFKCAPLPPTFHCRSMHVLVRPMPWFKNTTRLQTRKDRNTG